MTDFLRILVVDDERISRHTTVRQLEDAGYRAQAASDGREGLEMLDAQAFDVILTDLRMPGMSGIELLTNIKERAPEVEVILMTAYATVETAVAAMQGGAVDFLSKPFAFAELELRLRRIAELADSRREVSRLRALLKRTTMPGLVGQSRAMVQVGERISLFADNVVPVLITGETGTGKEVVSRMIHHAGSRRSRSFVPLACGAIPKELAEAELFGHEKGAFTGASQRHRGCFERADRGTLLLDDIDDLPLELQAKLVRVLQEGTFARVGGDQPIRVDVRVVATTKVDLGEAVDAGRFRDDLYYRLRGLEIRLPRLRERGDDVMLLAQHFLSSISDSQGTPPKTLDRGAVAILRAHSWPGNVRELRRVIESAVALCRDGDTLTPAHLPDALTHRRSPSAIFSLRLEGAERIALPELLRQFEDEAIQWAMRQAKGSQTHAAEMLGIPRTSLQSKIVRHRED
ncbi:MAG: sigma-54-dependent Fis family transcriptional regulator [Deltaproteobacteria bacterium]|nr:sigma-54-dependent Fis family transcriptional regulator [Deltaproteobacteria bacterium]